MIGQSCQRCSTVVVCPLENKTCTVCSVEDAGHLCGCSGVDGRQAAAFCMLCCLFICTSSLFSANINFIHTQRPTWNRAYSVYALCFVSFVHMLVGKQGYVMKDYCAWEHVLVLEGRWQAGKHTIKSFPSSWCCFFLCFLLEIAETKMSGSFRLFGSPFMQCVMV